MVVLNIINVRVCVRPKGKSFFRFAVQRYYKKSNLAIGKIARCKESARTLQRCCKITARDLFYFKISYEMFGRIRQIVPILEIVKNLFGSVAEEV